MTRAWPLIAALLLARPSWADPPELRFEALPATDVDLIDAGGYRRPYRMRGVEGRAVLPACERDTGCAPYVLKAEGPLGLEARVPSIPLRIAKKGGVSGQLSVAAGVAVRHAAHDTGSDCRVQLGLGPDEPSAREEDEDVVAYHVTLPCKVIEVGEPKPPQTYVPAPPGFRRIMLSGDARTRTLLGASGAPIVLDTLRDPPSCGVPRVYGKNTARKLEVMIVGAGQWVRGVVPVEEEASYSPVHVLPGCHGRPRSRRSYARGPDEGRAVVIAPGTMLRARDFEAAVVQVTRPVRARVVERARSLEIVRWTAGVDYLCRRDVDEGPCVPGLFVREADLQDDPAAR